MTIVCSTLLSSELVVTLAMNEPQTGRLWRGASSCAAAALEWGRPRWAACCRVVCRRAACWRAPGRSRQPAAGPVDLAGGLHHPAKAKRIVYLFQSGGPSQLGVLRLQAAAE